MLKIHMGCGKRDFGKDWVHIDQADFDHIDSKDIYLKKYETDTVDLIYASHFIEYFNREEITYLLRNWYDTMKPGGLLRLAVPDFNQMVKLYIFDNMDIYPIEKFLGPLYGKMETNSCYGPTYCYHKTAYDFPSLKNLLESHGFKNVRRYYWRDTEHAHIDDHSQAYLPHMDKQNGTLISLNVECNK
jgi:SAM-dependent methyltransferase